MMTDRITSTKVTLLLKTRKKFTCLNGTQPPVSYTHLDVYKRQQLVFITQLTLPMCYKRVQTNLINNASSGYASPRTQGYAHSSEGQY